MHRPGAMRPLQWIIAYKGVRAAAAFLAGLTLFFLVATRLDVWLRELVLRLGTGGLGETLQWAADQRHLLALGALLTLDGVVTLVEAYALWRGLWWGPWLVVIASSLLVPFEVAAIVTNPNLLRVGVLGLNLAIVAWLLRARLLRGPEMKVVHALKTGSAGSAAPASLP